MYMPYIVPSVRVEYELLEDPSVGNFKCKRPNENVYGKIRGSVCGKLKMQTFMGN